MAADRDSGSQTTDTSSASEDADVRDKKEDKNWYTSDSDFRQWRIFYKLTFMYILLYLVREIPGPFRTSNYVYCGRMCCRCLEWYIVLEMRIIVRLMSDVEFWIVKIIFWPRF